MNYKAGDKVKMKRGSTEGQENFLKQNNHVFTIEEYDGKKYLMHEDYMWYGEYSIDGLYEEEVFESIENRWEILDIR